MGGHHCCQEGRHSPPFTQWLTLPPSGDPCFGPVCSRLAKQLLLRRLLVTEGVGREDLPLSFHPISGSSKRGASLTITAYWCMGNQRGLYPVARNFGRCAFTFRPGNRSPQLNAFGTTCHVAWVPNPSPSPAGTPTWIGFGRVRSRNRMQFELCTVWLTTTA